MTNRPKFSSQWATVMTMTGLAVGLGNVWRFPYMMGQHGGGAFLVMYLLLMLAFAVPAMSAEWAFGRSTGRGPIGAMAAAFGKTPGTAAGIIVLLSVLVTASYYSLVVGNVAYSTWFAVRHGFAEQTLETYQAELGNHPLQLAFALLVVLASTLIVTRGLKRGVELANVVLVPLFGVAAVYLIFAVLRLDGAFDKLRGFITPDFSRLNVDVAFAALGQACFSVGLSGTVGVVLGSYLRRRQAVLGTALTTAGLDVMAALLAALFVVPAVLMFGIDMTAGPGLLFDTLPHLFSLLPGGRWLAGIFLLSWVSVALLSIVATLDTLTTGFGELQFLAPLRRWLTPAFGLAIAILVTPIAFNPQWLGMLDNIFGSGMFILGSLLAITGLGWGLGKQTTAQEVDPNGTMPWLVFWIRWVIPPTVAVILIGFVYSSVTGGH
ncbi:MAG: sodium-dependent transporter [Pseudomonadota bacterium]